MENFVAFDPQGRPVIIRHFVDFKEATVSKDPRTKTHLSDTLPGIVKHVETGEELTLTYLVAEELVSKGNAIHAAGAFEWKQIPCYPIAGGEPTILPLPAAIALVGQGAHVFEPEA